MTVERLKALFQDVEVVRHDLAADGPLPADLHLMHRIDAELSTLQWCQVFERVEGAVLFVPSTILSLTGAGKELVRRARRPHATSAGWFRNEAALRALWSTRFVDRRVMIGGLPGFVLSRRPGR